MMKTGGSEFGALLWWCLTRQKKKVIWMHNYSPLPPVHNNPKDILENLLPM